MPRAEAREDLASQRRPSEGPWTAARCSRVLRQLQILLGKLQKWHEGYVDVNGSVDSDVSTTQVYNKVSSTTGSRKQYRQPRNCLLDGEDRETTAFERLKKPMIRYRSKKARGIPSIQTPARSSARCENPRPTTTPMTVIKPQVDYSLSARCPNKISLATEYKQPMARKRRKSQHKNYDIDKCSHDDLFPYFSFDLTQRSAMDSSSYEYIALDSRDVIAKFLVATAPQESPSSWNDSSRKRERGVKSLLSLSLRKLAETQLAEQELHDAENDPFERQDLMNNFLVDLQEHFELAEMGWAHLREITRHYGIATICHAIRNGYLRQNVARELAVMTFQNALMADAGEAFVQFGLIPVQPRVLPTQLHGNMFSCQSLPAFLALSQYGHDVSDGHRSSFIHAAIDEALRNKTSPLHLSWIGHGGVFSNTVNQILISGRARELLLTIVRESLQPNEDDVVSTIGENTECQAMSREVGMASSTEPRIRLGGSLDLVKEDLVRGITLLLRAIVSRKHKEMETTLSLLVIQMFRLIEQHPMQRFSKGQQDVISHIMLAHLCHHWSAGEDSFDDGGKALGQLVWAHHDRRQLMSGMTKMLVRVGNYCMNQHRFGLFRDLVTTMLRRVNCLDETMPHVCLVGTAVTDTALEFATAHPSPEIIEWASSIDAKTYPNWDKKVIPGNDNWTLNVSESKPVGINYRWEHTMHEWVAKTPAGKGMIGSEVLQSERIRTGVNHTAKSLALCDEAADGRKRKAVASDWETCQDGDFSFKRRISGMHDIVEPAVAEKTRAGIGADHSPDPVTRLLGYDDETSEDELSLLA